MRLFLSILSAGVLTLTARSQLVPTNEAPVVGLAWTASPSAGVTNYFIYEGTNAGSYQSKFPTGTNVFLTVSNLTRGVAVFFNVTAQAGGLEGPFGGEISYTPASPPAGPAFQPIVVLVVQSSPEIAPATWTTLATLSLAANSTCGFFRTKINFPP